MTLGKLWFGMGKLRKYDRKNPRRPKALRSHRFGHVAPKATRRKSTSKLIQLEER